MVFFSFVNRYIIPRSSYTSTCCSLFQSAESALFYSIESEGTVSLSAHIGTRLQWSGVGGGRGRGVIIFLMQSIITVPRFRYIGSLFNYEDFTNLVGCRGFLPFWNVIAYLLQEFLVRREHWFAELNNLLGLRTFLKCGTLQIWDLRTCTPKKFADLHTSEICGFATAEWA